MMEYFKDLRHVFVGSLFMVVSVIIIQETFLGRAWSSGQDNWLIIDRGSRLSSLLFYL